MNRTHPTPLIVIAVVGVVIGFLIDTGLTATGYPVAVPPVTLSVTLLAIAVIIVLIAWPVRRAVHGTATARIDPFRAARTAVLAKACSLAGALLAGASAGILVYLLTRTVLGSTSSLVLAISAVVAALLLMVGGLVAEAFCSLPPSSGDDDEGPSSPAGPSHL